jgi:hypothetical protein
MISDKKNQRNAFNKDLGAFAARRIAQYTYFGPYIGYKHNDSVTASVSRYAWKVRMEAAWYSFVSSL